tara:strand:- start:2321 stop:3577 length:1257 start_codon:yes stop_codon:yes gene_type:complete
MIKKILFFIFVIYILLYPPKILYNFIVNSEIFSKIYIKLFPYKNSIKICSHLENNIKNIIYPYSNNYSITVSNQDGNIILNINGNKPRIPASNQKLITTAYALNKLGPNKTLNTKLYNTIDGHYYILGNGNPDLSIREINLISEKIINNLPYNYNKKVSITFFEEPNKYWWTSSWSNYDRSNTYGSPITRLAINSNSNSLSLINPPNYLKELIDNKLNYYGLSTKYNILSPNTFNKLNKPNLLLKIKSAPLYVLLSLSNSESHNFTAEVLLRNSLDNWNENIKSTKILNWLRFKRISVDGFEIIDGSGLSRNNRATTFGLVRLLESMDKNKHSDYYLSSLSLYGVRGTLKNYPYSINLDSKFYGKTGTLEGVRSISGYLKNKRNKLYISIIANNIYESDPKVERILKEISSINCSSGN